MKNNLKKNIKKLVLKGFKDYSHKDIYRDVSFIKLMDNTFLNEFDYVSEDGLYSNKEIIKQIHKHNGVLFNYTVFGPAGGNNCYKLYMKPNDYKAFLKVVYDDSEYSEEAFFDSGDIS